MAKAPKIIYLQYRENNKWNEGHSYSRMNEDDIKYIRHDSYAALLEAAVSLHHWLFELLDKEIVTPANCYPEGSDTREVIESAQLALDAWNRFLDGEE